MGVYRDGCVRGRGLLIAGGQQEAGHKIIVGESPHFHAAGPGYGNSDYQARARRQEAGLSATVKGLRCIEARHGAALFCGFIFVARFFCTKVPLRFPDSC
jgi:hypothetical protein